MGVPLATTNELGVYLETTVDSDRANLVLQLAHDKCELYVSPVPDLAKGVELAIAARAYNNVTSAHQLSLGSANVSFGAQNSTTGVGGLYVSRSEKADLRRAAGRTGAFSINMLRRLVTPTMVPMIAGVSPSGAATGEIVLIDGTGFTGATVVTIGGVSTSFFVGADTRVYADMPAGSVGSVPVVVTNAIGASAPYTYARA